MWKHYSISSWPPIWFMPTSKDTRVPSLSGGQECMRKPISPSLPIYAPNSKRASQKGWVKSSLRSMDKTEMCGIAMYSWSSMICLNSKSCEKKRSQFHLGHEPFRISENRSKPVSMKVLASGRSFTKFASTQIHREHPCNDSWVSSVSWSFQ